MEYFLGIDGGGTKTKFAIFSVEKGIIYTESLPSCSFEQHGETIFREVITNGLNSMIEHANISIEEISSICAGIACYGENPVHDKIMETVLKDIFYFAPLLSVNDVEVGWAGSLALNNGISIVSGTGSIFFGKNQKNEVARSGGWGEFIGDEGSAYWLGKLAISIFSKQSDGRLPRGPLYDIIKSSLNLKSDLDIIEYCYSELVTSRKKVAAIQMFLLEAAKAGDKSAIYAYEMAAEEIALGVQALITKLEFTEAVDVSYSGGVFNVGNFLLDPLKARLDKMNATLLKPMFSPVEGAILLAGDNVGFSIPVIKDKLQNNI